MATTPAFKVIDNYIYFYHLDKFCVLPTYPDSLTDSMSTNFTSTNALSRSSPVFSYINSGPRSLSVELKFHRDMMNDLNRNLGNLKDNVVDFSGDDYVDTLVKYLQAAALPKYQEYSSGSKSVIPPMVALRFGSDVFIKGVINSSIQCTYEKPILYNNKYALVSVSFTVFETDPYDADSVAAQGSFRGLTSTFRSGIYNSTDSDGSSLTDSTLSNWSDSSNTESIQSSFGGTVTKRKIVDYSSIGNSSVYTYSDGVTHGGGGSHKIDEPTPYSKLDTYVWKQDGWSTGMTGPYWKG